MKWKILFIVIVCVGVIQAREIGIKTRKQSTGISTTQPASFKSGNDSLAIFISEHVIYPEEARKNNITGEIMVMFVVDEDGNVENIRSAKRVKKKKRVLADEAIRVISLTNGMWNPGVIDGKKVKSRCQIPIDFVLED